MTTTTIAILQIMFTMMMAIYSSRGLPNPESHQDRLYGVAEDFIAVGQAEPIFAGEAAPEATALALYAVTAHESGFHEGVQDCSACWIGGPLCDHGKSITLFQLQGPLSWGPYTRQQLCSDNARATERGRFVLSKYQRAGTTHGLFAGYAQSKALGAEMNWLFLHACRKAGIVVQFRGGALSASFVENSEQNWGS